MPVKKDGRRFLAKVPGAPSPSPVKNVGVSHCSAERPFGNVPASHSERAPRPVLTALLRWITVALVIFAVLAIHDHATLAALAALAAVVLGMVAEVAP